MKLNNYIMSCTIKQELILPVMIDDPDGETLSKVSVMTLSSQHIYL